MKTLLLTLRARDFHVETLAPRVARAELRGWLRVGHSKMELLLQGSRWGFSHFLSDLAALSDVPNSVVIAELANWPQIESRFQVYPLSQRKTVYGARIGRSAEPVVIGCIDRVDHRGHLVGWALRADDPLKPCGLELYVDGLHIGRLRADSFRRDLVPLGLGYGRNGIDIALPDRLKDGLSHFFELRPTDGKPSRGELTRTLPVPASMRTPDDPPWLSQNPSLSASREAEHLFTRGRSSVISGALAEGYALLRSALYKEPSYVFRDFGLREYHQDKGTYLPGIRERMSDRWQAWYGASPCGRSHCCKQTPHGMEMEDCSWWPRFFASKKITKEWALAEGYRVPRTYAITQDISSALTALETERFVLKPADDSGRGLFLMHGNLNLFDRHRYTKEAILDAVEEYRRTAGRSNAEFILEELIVQEGVHPAYPVVPLDYKLHVFGGRVMLVHVDDRNRATRDPLSRQQAWLSRDWTPARFRVRLAEVEGDLPSQPSCFAEMLDIAESIGAQAKTYLRVDMYATDDGAVLGEVTTYSFGGNGFTSEGDLMFSQLWELFEDENRFFQPTDELVTNAFADKPGPVNFVGIHPNDSLAKQ